MGVWQRSPAGIAIALANPDLTRFDAALPDWNRPTSSDRPTASATTWSTTTWADPTGWPRPGPQLAARGMGLILDFVPNHVAPDHPWVTDRPELFVPGTPDDLHRDPLVPPGRDRSSPTAATPTSRPGRTWSS